MPEGNGKPVAHEHVAWKPGVLSGCDLRQGNQPTTDTAPTSPPAMGVDPSVPATNGKVSRVSVQYQATPKGELKCGDCMHFGAATSTCKLAEGQISSDGWCSLRAENDVST